MFGAPTLRALDSGSAVRMPGFIEFKISVDIIKINNPVTAAQIHSLAFVISFSLEKDAAYRIPPYTITVSASPKARYTPNEKTAEIYVLISLNCTSPLEGIGVEISYSIPEIA